MAFPPFRGNVIQELSVLPRGKTAGFLKLKASKGIKIPKEAL
jgi:hypothetical protein